MRYAILSDIHGNFAALWAVMQDLDRVERVTGQTIDQRWCLGDVVGYGPEPGRCVELVRKRFDVCLAGNHDWAAIERLDLAEFSDGARASAEWTRGRLTREDYAYLYRNESLRHVGDFTLAHGSPADPIWEYLTTEEAAAESFACFDTLVCVVGHSHLPLIFLQPITDLATHLRAGMRAAYRPTDGVSRARSMNTPGGPTRGDLGAGFAPIGAGGAGGPCTGRDALEGLWRIPQGWRAIINPGSVGQPRDGDPRASYVIYDGDQHAFEFRRIPYNVAQTQRRIREEFGGDPLFEQLAERLGMGT